MHEAVSNTPSHLGLAPHDSSCYAKCMFGGVLASGLTHAGITPFEIAFVSPFCSDLLTDIMVPRHTPCPLKCSVHPSGSAHGAKGIPGLDDVTFALGVMMLFKGMHRPCRQTPNVDAVQYRSDSESEFKFTNDAGSERATAPQP